MKLRKLLKLGFISMSMLIVPFSASASVSNDNYVTFKNEYEVKIWNNTNEYIKHIEATRTPEFNETYRVWILGEIENLKTDILRELENVNDELSKMTFENAYERFLKEIGSIKNDNNVLNWIIELDNANKLSPQLIEVLKNMEARYLAGEAVWRLEKNANLERDLNSIKKDI
ncbi:hypothetical protein VO56_00060 [Mycoplasmopsis gallinacea]|uniref:Uncharacterized protein n=1 Tax=Mycoplasmopsis gallinacea TaxID=29556 RepID=A0A0D5ZJ68_9BACT|nr:hypothetical protein VO56_00060 [Mycoplasmopsis gallinacea]